MWWDCAEQIVEAIHGTGFVRLGEDPAATEAAEAVDFCEAAGYHEFFSQVEGCARRVFVNGVEIDLVDQEVCVYAAGDVTDFAESGFGSQDAGGVVEIGDDDELGLAGDGVANFGRVE